MENRIILLLPFMAIGEIPFEDLEAADKEWTTELFELRKRVEKEIFRITNIFQKTDLSILPHMYECSLNLGILIPAGRLFSLVDNEKPLRTNESHNNSILIDAVPYYPSTRSNTGAYALNRNGDLVCLDERLRTYWLVCSVSKDLRLSSRRKHYRCDDVTYIQDPNGSNKVDKKFAEDEALRLFGKAKMFRAMGGRLVYTVNDDSRVSPHLRGSIIGAPSTLDLMVQRLASAIKLDLSESNPFLSKARPQEPPHRWEDILAASDRLKDLSEDKKEGPKPLEVMEVR